MLEPPRSLPPPPPSYLDPQVLSISSQTTWPTTCPHTGRSGAVLPHPAAPPSPPRPRRPGPGQLRPGGPTPAPPSSVLDVPGPARGEGSGSFCFSTIAATISAAEHGAQGGERRISMKNIELHMCDNIKLSIRFTNIRKTLPDKFQDGIPNRWMDKWK